MIKRLEERNTLLSAEFQWDHSFIIYSQTASYAILDSEVSNWWHRCFSSHLRRSSWFSPNQPIREAIGQLFLIFTICDYSHSLHAQLVAPIAILARLGSLACFFACYVHFYSFVMLPAHRILTNGSTLASHLPQAGSGGIFSTTTAAVHFSGKLGKFETTSTTAEGRRRRETQKNDVEK